MKYNRLGNTGLFVSEICLGAMTFGGQGFWRVVGDLDQTAATKLVSRALEGGVNFIDTADVYSEGQSEIQLGQALNDIGVKRSEVVIESSSRPNAMAASAKVPTTSAHPAATSWTPCNEV
jgi:aryl-alcohol dehydrogenase-like predicted oxidoreductase